MCMAKNDKDNEHTRREHCKMQKIDYCEVVLQLVGIATKNVGEHDLTPRMKYSMVILNNWDRTLVQEGWQNTGYSIKPELFITGLD